MNVGMIPRMEPHFPATPSIDPFEELREQMAADLLRICRKWRLPESLDASESPRRQPNPVEPPPLREPAFIVVMPRQEGIDETRANRARKLKAAPGTSGLYQQERLLLRSSVADRLKETRKDFNTRKSDGCGELVVHDLVNAALAFVLYHVDFERLRSVGELDEFIAAEVTKSLSEGRPQL